MNWKHVECMAQQRQIKIQQYALKVITQVAMPTRPHLVIAIPEIPICGFPEIPFSPKSRNSGIFQAKIPEIRDFHFLH